ncbi:S-layer homology domain-containing protein [Bacillus smithii]|uniref:S-layer homology domain-containing protein n=1 Tax=Bacillus smithii TaxID=1479 RepID=UPI002E1AC825|nr:S-layer homology domain-containing protein [Bacillus smithii]
MAYQPKSYRKFVATAATATLVATAVTPAFAAENLPFGDVNKNYAEAVGALYSKNIVSGISKTEFGTYKNLTRGDAAVIIAKALELDTKNAPDAGFKDVNSRIKGAVNALVAEGIINGVSKDKFDPDAPLTRGAMAKILVNAYNLKDYAKETPFTDLTSTFKPYVEALYGAGITKGKGSTYGTNEKITRGDFANMLYKAMNIEAPKAESIKALDDITVDEGTKLEDVKLPEKVTVVYSDKSEKEASVKWDTSKLDTSKPGTYKVEGTVDGTKLTASVNVVVKEVAPKIESVSAVASNTLKVEFNKAVDDTKANITVKKGSVTVNTSKVTFSADKKSAEIQLASKLFEGEYTVNVTGLSDQTLSGSVTVDNEKVAKIELLGNVAPITDGSHATVAYRVLNQYGEDITKSPIATSIEWHASSGVTAADDDKGLLTLTKSDGFKTGDKVALTGINTSTNTVVSDVVTVSDASATDTVEFDGVYNKDGKEFSGDLDVSDFALLLTAKDQYGKTVKADQVNDDVVFTSSNPSVLTVDKAYDEQGKDKNQVGLKFKAGSNYANGGKVIITAISKSSGKVSQFEVNVKAAPKLDTFTLSAPTDVVAAGETVKIPFTAVDQYGNAITKYDDLENKVTFSSNNAELKKDASGNAYLEYKAPDTKGLQVLVATVAGSGKVSQLTIDVKDAAYPATIESLKDVTTTVSKNGSVKIGLSNLVVKDQYGRTFDLKGKLSGTAGLGKYRIVATDSENGAVKVDNADTSAEITADDGIITITGLEKGSEDVTFKLQQSVKNSDNTYSFEDVATSPLKVTFNTVDKSAFTSFEVGDIAPLYADGTATTYKRDLKVYGVKADGTKVELPSSDYTVITDNNVAYDKNTGTLSAVLDATSDADKFGTKDEITSKVTVIVDGFDTPSTITKDVVISKEAPKADKIEFTDAVSNGVASIPVSDLSDDSDASDLDAVLKVTDQYGVKIDSPAPIITVTNVKEKTVDADPSQRFKVEANGSKTIDIQNAEAGDTFTVTYLLDGKTATVKFTVAAK